MKEDIKLLKQVQYIFKRLKINGWINDIKRDFNIDEVINAIENILNELERLQKENEGLQEENMQKSLEVIGAEEYTKANMQEIIEQYYTANEDCVRKSVIQNKISELSEKIKNYIKQKEYNQVDLQLCKRNILQELLEE